MVPSGLRQRISTSAPRSRPERMSTIGWKYGTNSPALSARSISSIGLSRSRRGNSDRKRENDDREKSAGDGAQCAQIALAGGEAARRRRDGRLEGVAARRESATMLSSRFGPGAASPASAITAPPAVSIRAWKQTGRPRATPAARTACRNKRGNAVARTCRRDGGCGATVDCRRGAPVRASAAAGRQRLGRDDLALLRRLPTSVQSVRPSGATIDSSLTGVVPNVVAAARRRGDAAGIDAPGRKVVEGRYGAGDAASDSAMCRRAADQARPGPAARPAR